MLLFTLILWLALDSSSAASIAASIGKSIQSDIQAVKQPIDETIAYVGDSQCSNVKKLLGVTYEQIEGEKEPDLNQLTLEFRNQVVRSIYKIDAAARALPDSSDFKAGEKLVVFVHGFTDDPSKGGFGNISEAFLSKGDYNVVALDGSSLIKWLYLRSTTYVRFMGERLGTVLAAMTKNSVDPRDILIVGHSLGAHISGFAGKTFYELTKRKVGRISALDPAGPCFSQIEPELRLKATDAEFVDVVHSDAGVYGINDAVGHVDYYPNSGSQQPNCLLQTCSHSRAWVYYSESVLRPQSFPAKRCDDWNAFKNNKCQDEISYMGYASKPGTKGRFYLQTNDESPYGKGTDGLKFAGEKGVVKNLVNGGQSAAKGLYNATSVLLG